MSLLCKLINHKYGEEKEKEKIEEKNGRQISVKVKTKTCLRCGYTKEDSFRTIVESQEKDNKNQELDDSFSKKESNTKSDTSPINTSPISPKESSGAIIIEDENEDENEDDEEQETNPVRVTCTECEYEDIDYSNHRRSGDYCPKCDGWLKIDIL